MNLLKILSPIFPTRLACDVYVRNLKKIACSSRVNFLKTTENSGDCVLHDSY